MNTSFSRRISSYFGGLFVTALLTLFALWYVGVPQLGLLGEGDQLLADAMRNLERAADYQRAQIVLGIRERRGDLLVFAESGVLTNDLATGGPAFVASFTREFDRLQRAYPDRYRKLMVVSTATNTILASSKASETGLPFVDSALIRRAAQPGMTELIESEGEV